MTSTPTVGTNRSADFLIDLSDAEYRGVYKRAILPPALHYRLMSKAEFQNFTQSHVPALRSVMEHQVLRWIFPSPRKTKRYAAKADLASALREKLFEKKDFDDPAMRPRTSLPWSLNAYSTTYVSSQQGFGLHLTTTPQLFFKILRRISCKG